MLPERVGSRSYLCSGGGREKHRRASSIFLQPRVVVYWEGHGAIYEQDNYSNPQ